MRVYLALYAASDSNIAILRQYPPYIHRLLNPDIAEAMEESVHKGEPLGFWSSMLGARKPRDRPRPPAFLPPEGNTLDLDKAWHGLHFLLTGMADATEPPLDFLVAGGHQIGPEEDGLLALSADETRAIAAALAPLTREQLLARYVPARMRELAIAPPDRWQEVEEPEFFEGDFIWAFEYFEQLQAFVVEAAANGLGVVKEFS